MCIAKWAAKQRNQLMQSSTEDLHTEETSKAMQKLLVQEQEQK